MKKNLEYLTKLIKLIKANVIETTFEEFKKEFNKFNLSILQVEDEFVLFMDKKVDSPEVIKIEFDYRIKRNMDIQIKKLAKFISKL